MPLRADLSLIVFVSFDSAIDLKIDRCKVSVAFLLPADLDPLRAVPMVKQIHPLSDELHRRFEQISIQGQGPVFGYPSAGNHAKMVF